MLWFFLVLENHVSMKPFYVCYATPHTSFPCVSSASMFEPFFSTLILPDFTIFPSPKTLTLSGLFLVFLASTCAPDWIKQMMLSVTHVWKGAHSISFLGQSELTQYNAFQSIHFPSHFTYFYSRVIFSCVIYHNLLKMHWLMDDLVDSMSYLLWIELQYNLGVLWRAVTYVQLFVLHVDCSHLDTAKSDIYGRSKFRFLF